MLADAVGTCLSTKGLNFDNVIASEVSKRLCPCNVILCEKLIILGYATQKFKEKKLATVIVFIVFNCDKVHFAHSTSDYNRLTFFPELIISNLNDIEVSGRFLDHTSLVN